MLRVRGLGFHCPGTRGSALRGVSLGVKRNSFAMVYNTANYKGAALLGLVGGRLTPTNRGDNRVLCGKGDVSSLDLHRDTYSVKFIKRGPSGRVIASGI